MTELAYAGSELTLFATATRWKSYWASRVAPFVGGKVLDVGAGIGATIETLTRYCPEAVWSAIEPDPVLCQHLQRLNDTGRFNPGIDITCGITADLSTAEAFDTLLYIDVLEHIEDDREELRQARRLLRHDGRLVVLAPAHPWLYTPFDREIGHFRRYTRSSLAERLGEQFDVLSIEYLDSVGMLASMANRFLLRSAHPAPRQIALWDRVLVPASQWVDPLLLRRVGKSVLAVAKRRGGG